MRSRERGTVTVGPLCPTSTFPGQRSVESSAQMINRRSFLRAGACASAAGLLGKASLGVAPDVSIEVTLQEQAPLISPHLYGQFLEHLGGVIYDGVWVGRDSRIENVNGIRKQFVDDMKRIAVPNFRWPGGCFADGYRWRDGIGDPLKRPRTYNYWQMSMPPGVDATETNQFGLHEFMQLCRLTGAEPYLAANMASGSPREFHDLVSYCNAPQGTVSLASERAANGDRAPFAVHWWGVGNESWGCGGDMTPEQYAALYRIFVTQFPAYAPKPFFVAVGPRGHSKDMDVGWTEGLGAAMRGHKSVIDGLSVHFYTDFRNSPERVATFDASGWYDVLREGARMEAVIEQHWGILGRYDSSHHTRMVIDEWGVWYRPGEEIGPTYLLSQPLTLRDALHTAMTLDIFNRHADKLAMANVAQTINCLHSLFLAQGDRYARTPVYSVFEMYQGHSGGQLASIDIHADTLKVPSRSGTGSAIIPAVSGSASLKNKIVTVTLTNPSLETAVHTSLRVIGRALVEGRGRVLTHPEMNATNSLDHPTEVRPALLPVVLRGERVEFSLPPRAVAVLELNSA